MKNLNIKTLSKGMRVEDKAKLLFSNRNKMAETEGKERLLTADEEEAIIKDAQSLNQITELNRLNRLYNLATYILLDIQTAYLHFKIVEQKLIAVITGITLTGELHDSIDHLIYETVSKEFEDGKEVDEKASELRKKHMHKTLSSLYDYFEPAHRDKSYFTTDDDSNSEPNRLLQQTVMQAVDGVKKFKTQVYTYKRVEKKAGIELLGDRERKMIKEFRDEMDTFIKLEDFYSIISIYPEFAEKGLLRTSNLHEPKFIASISDMKKATRLSKKHKKKLEKELDELIIKHQN